MKPIAVLGILLVTSVCVMADEAGLGPDQWLRRHIEGSLRPGATLQQAKERMRDYFYYSDVDGTGVSASSHDKFLQEQRARRRALLIDRVLALDLDGDGVITREEIETVSRIYAASGAPRSPLNQRPDQNRWLSGVAAEVERWLKYDRNGDGRITLDEVLAGVEDEVNAAEAAQAKHSKRSLEEQRAQQAAELVPLALDADGDGVVSLAEFDAAVERVFREYDDDGDGVISAAEAAAHANRAAMLRKAALESLEQQKREQTLRERVAGCALPSLAADAKLILFGTAAGAGVSNVSLGGDDEVIEVADVVVEPGAEPLVLVLTSRAAMIWRISGATDRLIRAIVASDKSVHAGGSARGGVIGLPRDRVSFAGRTDCVPAFSRPDDEDRAATALAAALGRPADLVHTAGRTGTVHLPSGSNDLQRRLQEALAPPRRDPAAELYDAVRHEFPSSLITINPDDVVSPVAATRYPVLPLEAGIAQLVDEGAVTIARYYRLRQPGKPETSHRLAGEIRVKRQIRIPAGLSITRTFVLESGVPMPDVNVGKHCIRTDDGHVLANGSNCRF
jgi:Ca2+-binding EF-hand superfamily protein